MNSIQHFSDIEYEKKKHRTESAGWLNKTKQNTDSKSTNNAVADFFLDKWLFLGYFISNKVMVVWLLFRQLTD